MPIIADASVDQKFESIVGNVLGGEHTHAAIPVIIPPVIDSKMTIVTTVGVSPILFDIAHVLFLVLCQSSFPRDCRSRRAADSPLEPDVEDTLATLPVKLWLSISRGYFSLSVTDVVEPVLKVFVSISLQPTSILL